MSFARQTQNRVEVVSMISIVVAAIGKSRLAQKCSTSSIRAEIYGKTRATPPAFDRIAQKYTV
jgi:hypothetical protein